MSADAVVKGIIDYLKSNHRLDWLPQVAEKLNQVAMTAIDPDLATVTSASALSAKQKQALKATLSEIFGRPVRLKTEVDQSLLAGLRIAWNGKVVDTSLDQQLSKLNEALIYE